MKVPLLVWLLQVIPESLAMAALVMCMAERKPDRSKIMKIGLAYALAAYIVGWLSFTPGVHVVILSAVLGFLAIIFGGLGMEKALIFSAVSCAILILSEYVLFSVLVNVGTFSIEQIMNELHLRILLSYPQTLLLIMLAFIIRKKRINLINVFKI